jgi:DNA-binding beta-propeller fold protein YncE
MRDLDGLLADSLKSVARSYRPADLYGAQSEFLLRSRRRRAYRLSAAVALAGVGAAAALVIVQTQPFAEDESPVAQGREMVVTASINVGAEPSGVAAGAGSLWTANSGDGTVSRIDPEANDVVRTYDVGGEPDDVAVGADGDEAWVSNPSAGAVQRIDATEDGISDVAGELWEGGHIDVAVDEEGVLWAVASMTDGLIRVDSDEPVVNAFDKNNVLSGDWSDVAVGDGVVWLLDEGTSSVSRYDPATDEAIQVASQRLSDINDDLAVGEGYVWVANGDTGTVLRIDPATGHMSDPLQVGGKYAAVTTGEGAVWVLAVDDSGVGSLFEIDPDTVRILDRLTVTGDPADVVVADGSVWVTNNDTDTLTRVDLVE